MNENEKVDMSEIFLQKPHTCLICEKELPEQREIKYMFFCPSCEEFRKKYSPETTLGQLKEYFNLL